VVSTYVSTQGNLNLAHCDAYCTFLSTKGLTTTLCNTLPVDRSLSWYHTSNYLTFLKRPIFMALTICIHYIYFIHTRQIQQCSQKCILSVPLCHNLN